MKKSIATLVTLTLLSLAALPAAAQTRTRCSTRSVATYVSSYRGRPQSRYATRYNRNTQYQNNAYRVDANGNYVYDANGKFIEAWGGEMKGHAHGMDLRKEGGEEFLYFSPTGLHKVIKTNLKGEKVFELISGTGMI